MNKITLALCSTFLLSFNSFAQISINGPVANRLWNQIEKIGKNENTPIVYTENDQQVIHIEHIACVFEMYNGCSMFVNTANERKMIVALDGTADLMNQLAKIGVAVDEDNARMYIDAIDCSKDNSEISCDIQEEAFR
jgi:hypothetical protein